MADINKKILRKDAKGMSLNIDLRSSSSKGTQLRQSQSKISSNKATKKKSMEENIKTTSTKVSNCRQDASLEKETKVVTSEVINKRYKFNRMKQRDQESFADFLVRIKDAAAACEFGVLEEELICDRIVAGVLNSALRHKLLHQQTLDLTTAVNICENETTLLLTDLNADCLMKIFNYLNFFDLIAVGQINETFLEVAKSQMKYKTLTFATKYPRKLAVAEKVLRLYGSYVTTLVIDISHFLPMKCVLNVSDDQQLLTLIIRYCSGGALKKLYITSFAVEEPFVQELTPIMNNLDVLSISECNIEQSNLNALINQCVRLKQLNVISHKRSILPLQLNSSRLETIKFRSITSSIDRFEFLKSNPQIRSLDINAFCFRRNETLLDPNLLPNLQQLKLEYYNIVSLTKMINSRVLKKLMLTFTAYTVVTDFTALISNIAARNIVRELSISCNTTADISKLLFEALNGFKSLHILHLINWQHMNVPWRHLAGSLGNLTEFYLSFSSEMTKHDNITAELTKFVENATNLKRLTLFYLSQRSINLLKFFPLIVAHQQERAIKNCTKIIIYMTLDGFENIISQIDMTNIAFQNIYWKTEINCGKFVL